MCARLCLCVCVLECVFILNSDNDRKSGRRDESTRCRGNIYVTVSVHTSSHTPTRTHTHAGVGVRPLQYTSVSLHQPAMQNSRQHRHTHTNLSSAFRSRHVSAWCKLTVWHINWFTVKWHSRSPHTHSLLRMEWTAKHVIFPVWHQHVTKFTGCVRSGSVSSLSRSPRSIYPITFQNPIPPPIS